MSNDSSILQCIFRDRDWVRCTNDSVEGGNKCKYHLPKKVEERSQKAQAYAKARAQARAQYELEREQRERAEFRAREQARAQAREERKRIEMAQLPVRPQRDIASIARGIVNVDYPNDIADYDSNEMQDVVDAILGMSFEDEQPVRPLFRAGAGAIGYKPNMKTLRECECDICAEDKKRMIVLHCCRKEMCADCMIRITNAKCPFCKQDNNMIIE
jgi:hypothetical protein